MNTDKPNTVFIMTDQQAAHIRIKHRFLQAANMAKGLLYVKE